MDDSEIERILQRYQPADPPNDLLDRIVTGALVPAQRRTWPWAIAAAALLALVVGLHSGTVVDDSATDETRREIAALSTTLGGDALAHETAMWLVRSERLKATRTQP